METIEIKAVKSWKRDVIEYFEDLEIICNDYNRLFLRYLSKLNRLPHEERIDQSEYDDLKKTLLKASEAINNVPLTIQDLK
jgi:antitoxin component of RelBE/YafQ-DinJ toxin-antitoxin module